MSAQPHGRRRKKFVYVAATEETLISLVNSLRGSMKLKPLKPMPGLEEMARRIQMNEDIAQRDSNFVLLSLLSLVDHFEGEESAPQLVAKWMNEPERRPVLLAPGSRIYVKLDPQEKVVVLLVAEFYH
jgi:hypothetical protein